MEKGGKGSSIGGLVFLIAMFTILYMLVMPPCEKCQLLNKGDCDDVCEISSLEGVLFYEELGEIDLKSEIAHELEQVNLYIRVEPEEENLAGSLFADRGWFGNVDQDLSFNLENIDNLGEISFLTRVSSASGQLFVELNGHMIEQLTVDAPKSIIVSLPISYLKEKNKLKLYVNSPGLKFWHKNKYEMKDLRIRKIYEKIHYEESRNFFISEVEKEYLENSRLDYSVFCSSAGSFSILKIYLNDNLISSESIACESFKKSLNLDKTSLIIGENELLFVIDDGSYLLSPVSIINNLTQEVYPSYSFSVKESIYDSANKYILSLKMVAGDKHAKIIINDYEFDLNEDGIYFEKEITSFINEGNNHIEIIPENGLKIDEIRIDYK
ncbi:hypothetical protein HON86_01300 [Candidatus Woesearchaeota archaeon]|jgi:hypothetical protein|nr:hypothetical protein [Candidatus Woesearchaeota archaeon]